MHDRKPRTAEVHGALWGARAYDWAELQEVQNRPAFVAAFERMGLQPGATYLDVGCGSGLAVQIAAARGATVAGLDASPNLIAIARERTPTGEFHIGDLESLPFADHTLAQRGLRSSGLAARAVANSSEDAVYAAQEHALQPFRQADGSYVVPVSYRCLLARA